MKKLFKRLTALFVAASITASLICVGVNAMTTSKDFTGSSGYQVTFTLTLDFTEPGSAAYSLVTTAKEKGTKPYFYPSIWVKATLYGNSGTNSEAEKTVTNNYEASVSVLRGNNVATGKGYGQFLASGNATYGNVSGSLYL